MKRLPVIAAMTVAMSMGAASAAKITVWTHFGDQERGWMQQAAAAFGNTAAGRGHTFEFVNVDFGQLKQKMILSAPKGEGPDMIVSLPQDQLGELVAAGVLEPLDRYMNATQKAQFAKSGIEAMTYKGRLFGIPLFGEAVAVVYNKKLLPNGVPTTWDAFVKTAQGLTKPEQGQFGFLANIENQYHMHGAYGAYGAYVFKNTGGTYNVKDVGLANNGANLAGQLINDLRFKHKLIPEGMHDDNAAQSAFLAGKVAMWQTGPWSLGVIRDAKMDFGVGIMPRPAGATNPWRPFVGIQGIMVNSYSKNKQVAVDFAKFVTSAENQVAYYRAGGRIPVNLQASKLLANDPVVVGFGKAIANGLPMPNVAEMGQVWGPWGNAVSLIAKDAKADIKALNAAAVREIASNIK
ncbi:MAG TPA: maltose ABC transporter substrate-binding protein [Deinococcales bacterium]|nr:maltose ABC transporter substrate-binding protein [Deinococcales bacterium]